MQHSGSSALPARDGNVAIVRDGLRVILGVLLIFMVSRIHQQYPFIAKLRPILVVTALAGVYAYLNPRYLAKGSVTSVWPTKVMLFLLVFAVATAPFGLSIGNSYKFVLEAYAKTILYCMLLVAAVRIPRDLYTLIWAYVVGSAVLVVMGLFLFRLQTYEGDFSYERLVGLQSWDANDVCCVLMVGLPLTLLMIKHSARPLGRFFAMVTLAGIGALVARSGSRGGMLGLVAVGAAMVLLLRGVAVTKRAGLVVVTVLGLLAFAPPGYWEQMRTILSPKEDYNYDSDYGRRKLAQRGIGYMEARPLAGVGINNFPKAECTISPLAIAAGPGGVVRCRPPHNSFVQAGAELGVIGGAVWVWLVLYGTWWSLTAYRRMPRHWRRGTPEQRFMYEAGTYFGIGMIGFAVTSFFVTFAWLDIVYILAAYMAALERVALAVARDEATGGGTATHAAPVRAAGWRTVRAGVRQPARYDGDPAAGWPGGRSA